MRMLHIFEGSFLFDITFCNDDPVTVRNTQSFVLSSSLATNFVLCISEALMTPRSFSLSLLAITTTC